MSVEDKKKLASELYRQYEIAKEEARSLYGQYQAVRNEIAACEAKFKAGSVIAINKTKRIRTGGEWFNAKYRHEQIQEKYRITGFAGSDVLAIRIKKDGGDGAEKRLYSWDIEQAELVEPPK